MPESQESKTWFALIDQQQFGPLTDRELRELVSTGRLKKHHLVWRVGKDKKVAASNVRGLFRKVESPRNDDANEVATSPFDVFISYSSDDKLIADAICAELESRRIRCWIAPRDALPGIP